MQDIWQQIEPHIVEVIISLIAAGGAFALTWLRSRTQQLVVRQAVSESDPEGDYIAAAATATALASVRMGVATRPGQGRLSNMVADEIDAVKSRNADG